MKKIVFIAILVLVFYDTLCASEPVSNESNSCGDFIDSLRKENGNGEREDFLKMEQELTEPPKPRYFITGFGTSHFDNIGIGQLSYDFFLGRFWQLRDGFSMGVSGEVLTEFEKAILMDITLSALYYPFYTFISLLVRFLWVRVIFGLMGKTVTAFLVVWNGDISSNAFPFILMVSGRLDLLIELVGNRGLPLPLCLFLEDRNCLLNFDTSRAIIA
jgi:hypothetical protein